MRKLRVLQDRIEPLNLDLNYPRHSPVTRLGIVYTQPWIHLLNMKLMRQANFRGVFLNFPRIFTNNLISAIF